jgi:SAM-dependent methyltransferase
LSKEFSSVRLQNDTNTEYQSSAELVAIEEHLKGYNADIVAKMARYFKGKHSILEFGAGIGTLAIEWQKQTGVKPECIEIDLKQQQIIQNRGFVCHRSIADVDKKFDGAYSSNVFEHIEDDVSVLRDLHSSMAEGALLSVYVPAFRCLFSEIDASLGHYRRYNKAELTEKVILAGFKVVDCYYSDVIGFFVWFGAKFLGSRDGGSMASSASLQFYDKWVYPLSRTLDDLFMRRLLGKNLLLIARK